MSKELIVKILSKSVYDDQITLREIKLFSDTEYYVHVESPLLDGYNGMVDTIVDGDFVSFSRDRDV